MQVQANIDTEDIVRRLREAVAPERIVLFGSCAQGTSGPDSDLDLFLVVDTEDRRATRMDARDALWSIDMPVDIFVYTPSEYEEFKDAPLSFLSEILETGVVLHPAP